MLRDYPRDLGVRGERGMFTGVDGPGSWGEMGSSEVEVGDGSFPELWLHGAVPSSLCWLLNPVCF